MPRWFEKLITVFYFLKHRFFLDFETRRDIEDYQEQRLAKHLHWILQKSPFYRQQLKLTDPVIDKSVMMKNFDQLNTAGIKKEEAMSLAIQAETDRNFSPMLNGTTVGLSSGTSGHRGLFLANAFERAQYAGVILAKALPKKRKIKCPRVALFLRANSNLYEAVQSKLIQFQFFDILKELKHQVVRLSEYNPSILIAQPSVLRKIIEWKEELGLSLDPEVIYSAAEVLDPIDRAYIERAFPHSHLGEVYQCTEGFLGITCEQGVMHLNEDIVQIEKEFLPGSSTKFQPILTDLYRSTQPIVKYRLNDVLTLRPDPCPCGSPMTAIESIDGRHDDILYFARKDHEGYVPVFADFIRNHILYIASAIKEYYVTQTRDGNLCIQVDCEPEALSLAQEQIKEQIQNLAAKLNSETPSLEFSEFQRRQDFQKKMRRVVSEFSP